MGIDGRTSPLTKLWNTVLNKSLTSKPIKEKPWILKKDCKRKKKKGLLKGNDEDLRTSKTIDHGAENIEESEDQNQSTDMRHPTTFEDY